ncbi:MAG: FAD-dependent oxidoreductase [Chloroflexota bacterium]|nr:FAD-dependent oxidoreductase [Chloroflexota bacterium]
MQPVVVIGGGVIGLCSAFALRQRGVPVIVYSGFAPEQAASHVNAGWIVPTLSEPVPAPGLIATSLRWMLRSDSPLYIDPRLMRQPDFLRWTLRFWQHCNATDYKAGMLATAAFGARSMALYDALRAGGVEYEEHHDGLLFAYRSAETLEQDYAALEPIRSFGFEMTPILSSSAVRDLEPALSEVVTGGYWLPQERTIRPDTLVQGLRAALQQQGVEIRDVPVSGIETNGNRSSAVFADGIRQPASQIVVAAGAWTAGLLRPLRVPVPVTAGKGYSIDLAPQPLAEPVRRPLYLHETRVAITPMNGMIRLAGTMEFSGINHTLRQERVAAIARNAAWAIRGWPDPTPTSGPGVRVWTGMRPMTPDGLPVIGWLPGYRDIAVASGHAMMGVTLAPATGETVADLLTTGVLPEVARPFDPARFA